jgi:NADPH:quinone reductase-like Zn-dependent oxidoreductase
VSDVECVAGCELSFGLVGIRLPARLRSDDCVELGDEIVAHDRHIESASHRVAAFRPELPRQISESAGRTVLVTGGGPIGQLACRLAHLRSPAQILLMEPAPQRAQFATASHAVAIAADAAEDSARAAGVDVVFECSGSAAATATALKILAPGGILVMVGAGPDPGLDSATILLKASACGGRTSKPTNSTARSTCWPPGKSRTRISPQ